MHPFDQAKTKIPFGQWGVIACMVIDDIYYPVGAAVATLAEAEGLALRVYQEKKKMGIQADLMWITGPGGYDQPFRPTSLS